MPDVRLVAEGVTYPESPRWRGGFLYFSDVHDYAVKRVDHFGCVEKVAAVPGRPAGLGFLPDGRLLIASALDRKIWVLTDKLELACDLSGIANSNLNDMVVDGHGRAWVGDTGFNMMKGEPPSAGQVILVRQIQQDFVSSIAARDVWFPNGAAVDSAGRTYYVAESAKNRVSRHRITDTGLTDATVIAEFPSMPDGLCLDEEGHLWVALLREGEFRRVGPDGRTSRTVSAEGRLAVACVLGGADRTTLYLCSAETTFEDLAQGRSRGLIHATMSEPGAGWP